VTPFERLTSPAGALSLAVAALLVVLGVRIAGRARGGAAAQAAYAAAIVAAVLGAAGILPGPAPAAPAAVRWVGSALLVAGLLVAGAGSRGGARPDPAAPARPPARGRAMLGLTAVLAGHLLRAPSGAGAIAAAAAAAVLAAAAVRRDPPGA
jgi:hypothetical protein